MESTDSIFKFPAGIDDSDSLKVQKILNCPKGMSVAALLYEELARRDEGTLDRVAVIGKCCPEGDNIFDGVEIAHAIMSYSNLFSSRNQSLSIQDMKCPASWSAMYGPKLTNDTMFY